MEFCAWFGYAAKDLFTYNRENFQFDQGQRIDREVLRLQMQIKRFDLFREDIRDLVELTVGKMEMYHLVGALFLEFTILLYCQGRILFATPPFISGLFYLSVATAFLYLVLAVWLSMHASICSQSFGTRLLTRYVRLPIPSEAQLGTLNARLTDFERQGAQALRVPLVGGRQNWMQRQGLATVNENGGPPQQSDAQGGGAGAELLGRGEAALGDSEKGLLEHARRRPGKHVQLFRKLQTKWQCYDAYARVAMSLGVNQILFSIVFFLVITTNVQYCAPFVCFALCVPFQATVIAITRLDIVQVTNPSLVALFALQIIATMIPAVCLFFAEYTTITTVEEGITVQAFAIVANQLGRASGEADQPDQTKYHAAISMSIQTLQQQHEHNPDFRLNVEMTDQHIDNVTNDSTATTLTSTTAHPYVNISQWRFTILGPSWPEVLPMTTALPIRTTG
ncbi:unnamed protein product [Prorocentrum cordatum]|uniref:Autophagy-related protein 9 n=1 Tax=Prorocentrum cordatum TaxID=2364126 RepID=A0ABN9Q2W4_9DINO|nr:unnamed protein product [Polarella glacialis]